jgi:hypothetical protein
MHHRPSLLTWLHLTMMGDGKNDEKRAEREGAVYNKLDKTKNTAVADGYVMFTRAFYYCGSLVSYNLCDDEDVTPQAAATTASMGALKEVWWNPHLHSYSKYLLFESTLMNLFLWGCKTWVLWQSLLNKLEVFLNQSI